MNAQIIGALLTAAGLVTWLAGRRENGKAPPAGEGDNLTKAKPAPETSAEPLEIEPQHDAPSLNNDSRRPANPDSMEPGYTTATNATDADAATVAILADADTAPDEEIT